MHRAIGDATPVDIRQLEKIIFNLFCWNFLKGVLTEFAKACILVIAKTCIRDLN